MSTFSVIIPAFNCSEYISASIESVLTQSYNDMEIIVVDDGSTDSTIDCIGRYSRDVKILTQSNMGASAARNNGAKIATGRYLAFLDSDDLWLPQKLQMQLAKSSQGYEVSYTNRINIGEKGDLPRVQTDICPMPEGDIFLDLIQCNMITTSSVVIRRGIFDELGGFDEALSHCEDWDLWLKCAERYRIGVIKEPMIEYRLHRKGLHSNHLKMAEFRAKVIRRALKRNKGAISSKICRSKIMSSGYSASGWESAKSGDYRNSFRFYCKALWFTPCDSSLWYDVARLLTGRI